MSTGRCGQLPDYSTYLCCMLRGCTMLYGCCTLWRQCCNHRLCSLQPVQLVVSGGGGVEQLRVFEAFADLLEDRDRLVEEHREADPRQVFADRILFSAIVRPSVRRKVSRVPLIPSTPVRTERCAAVLSGAHRAAHQRLLTVLRVRLTGAVRPNVLTASHTAVAVVGPVHCDCYR